MSFAFVGAEELLARYRTGEVSPREVTDELLARIERLNPTLNAFLTVTSEIAQRQAADAESQYVQARRDGTLAALPALLGVPVSIKDLNAVAGVRTTLGSRAYRDHIPDTSCIIYERLEAAGAVLLGKTNTAEFGMTTVTDNRLGDSCGTPWDPARVAGGSSGGAGAAVAAGLGPLAQGSDSGGSIRIPAAYCGTFGIKPSSGRIPLRGRGAGGSRFNTDGPLTRRVRDAALMLQVTAGPDPSDPISTVVPPVDFLAATHLGSLYDLRIAWSPDLGFATVHSDVLANAERAVATLSEQGAAVEPATPEMLDPFDIFGPITMAGFAADYSAIYATHADDLTGYARSIIQRAQSLDPASVSRAYAALDDYRAQIERFFERYNLLVSPTVAVPAFPHHQFVREIEGKPVIPFWGATPFTAPFNMTLQPAASVPSGFSTEGLPTAIQIVGRRGEDCTVLRAAAALEEAQPWADRRPPIADF